MSVPEAVKRQEEEAAKLYEETYTETPDEKASEESTVDATPLEETPVAEETPVETPEEPEAPTVDYQEQYFTLKGKYEAEVPRLYQEIQAMQAQMQQMMQTQQPARLDDEPSEDNEDSLSRLEEDYGESFVNDLRTIFRSEIQQNMEPITNRLQQTESVAIKSGQERYFEELNDKVPDWQTIMSEPGFVNFVREADEFSGIPRYTLMQAAESSMDAKRMAKFYDAYKQRTGRSTGNGEAKKMAALTPGQTSTKSETTKSSQVEYVNSADIQRFATDVALRKYLGREDEQAKIQAKIDKAIAEGRVI